MPSSLVASTDVVEAADVTAAGFEAEAGGSEAQTESNESETSSEAETAVLEAEANGAETETAVPEAEANGAEAEAESTGSETESTGAETETETAVPEADSLSPSASPASLLPASNRSFLCPPPADYQSRLQQYVASHPDLKYNYLMDIPALMDYLLRQRRSSLFFRQRGSLASVLQQFGPALYHRCHKRRLEYSFCQYNWLVAWDSASREFYPFREQNRAIPDGLRRSPS